MKAHKPYGRNPYDKSPAALSRNPKDIAGEGRPFPFPRPFTYKSRKAEKPNILVLPTKSLRKLARQGGMDSSAGLPGFHRQSKSNMLVWNYPCPRPLFDNCWRFLTLKANSLHALALRFRTLYASIRWADMNPDEDDEVGNLMEKNKNKKIKNNK